MARLLLCLAVACSVQLAPGPKPASAFPMQPLMPHRRAVRSLQRYHPYQAYPEDTEYSFAPEAAYLQRPGAYYADAPDYDDYGQGQWLDTTVSDAAANMAFMQNLMEANRLTRLGVGLQFPYGRYQDPRYKDSDDYVFGSVTSSKAGRYDQTPASSAPPAYGRYQYRTVSDDDVDDDDQDVRDLHALAKKASSSSPMSASSSVAAAARRTDEQLLRDFEAQSILDATQRRARELANQRAQAEMEALRRANERAQAEAEAQRQANQRAEEFNGDVNDAEALELALGQGLEKLFAKSGIANNYVPPEEERSWNGRDPVWNGYWMGEDLPASPYDPASLIDHRASVSDRKKAPSKAAAGPERSGPALVPGYLAAVSKRSNEATGTASKLPVAATAPTTPPTAASSSKPASAARATAAPTPSKRQAGAGAGQTLSGQPEVALLRPAAAHQQPRPAPHHLSGVDEIRSLLRVQDTMREDRLPEIVKRSAPKAIVSDEGTLVKELNNLKKKSD